MRNQWGTENGKGAGVGNNTERGDAHPRVKKRSKGGIVLQHGGPQALGRHTALLAVQPLDSAQLKGGSQTLHTGEEVGSKTGQ